MILHYRLAGGVSTLESGFVVADVEPEQGENPAELPKLFGINPRGQVFVVFWGDRTIQKARNLSRSEAEAISGIKTLILGWN